MPILTWLGKEASSTAYAKTAIHALEPRDPKNPGSIMDDNLVIQGDNLLASKALLPFYANKIDMIYGDPVYNTGNEGWVYSDNLNSEETKDWFGKMVGPEDLNKSDKWLCMMQPRMQAAYDLLKEDGVALFSIDDNEAYNFFHLLNEVFGEANHIATLIWKTTTGANDAKYVSVQHEYIFIYAKNKELLRESVESWRINKPYVEEALEKADELINSKKLNDSQKSEQIKVWYKEALAQKIVDDYSDSDMSADEIAEIQKQILGGLGPYHMIDKKGLYSSDNASWPGGGGPRYDVLHPKTKKPCRVPSRGWAWKEETMKQRIAEDRILFGDDETTVPREKRYLSEIRETALRSIITDIPGGRGSQELLEIIGKKAFEYPKPSDLIARLVDLATNPGDVILDPFFGSGTTGHAVLRLNAENPGEKPRRFIGIEMEKDIEEKITSTRLNKVIKGYTNKRGKKIKGLGGSYSRWKVGKEVRKEDGSLGGASYFSLAQILAAHHGLPLVDKKGAFSNHLIAEDDAQALFFYHGKEKQDLTSEDLKEIEKISSGRRSLVYAHNSFVDVERAAILGIEIFIIPYDYPVQPIK